MKKLTAEEFAAKVMENGTEVEYEEWLSKDRGCEVWSVYAHIDEYTGEVTWHCGSDIRTISAQLELENQEQNEALMNGELDEMEKQLIIDELYPEYLKVLEDVE